MNVLGYQKTQREENHDVMLSCTRIHTHVWMTWHRWHHEMGFEDNAVGDSGVYKGATNLIGDWTWCHDHKCYTCEIKRTKSYRCENIELCWALFIAARCEKGICLQQPCRLFKIINNNNTCNALICHIHRLPSMLRMTIRRHPSQHHRTRYLQDTQLLIEILGNVSVCKWRTPARLWCTVGYRRYGTPWVKSRVISIWEDHQSNLLPASMAAYVQQNMTCSGNKNMVADRVNMPII